MKITEEIRKIKTVYGGDSISKYSSFAVGKYGVIPTDDEINENFNNKYFIVGLNLSAPLDTDWMNFHLRKVDGKVVNRDSAKKYFKIFEDIPCLKGCYMTDFFKGFYSDAINVDSEKFLEVINEDNDKNREYKKECKRIFEEELKCLNGSDTIIILAYSKLKEEMEKSGVDFTKYKVITVYHPAAKGKYGSYEKLLNSWKRIT